MKKLLYGIVLSCCLAAPAKSQSTPATGESSRYMLGLLDSRSIYGRYWFPEPLRGPEMDVDRELRVDYFHAEKKGRQIDSVKAEIEYNIGLLTLEVELPYERDSQSSRDPLTRRITHERSEGIGNLELSARHPIYQYVSANGWFDYTLAIGLEVAIPTLSDISRDTEIVPQIFQLLRLGDHLSVQASVGYSALIGPEEGGTNTLEYNVIVGYNIERDLLPLPYVLRTVPLLEVKGERGLSRDTVGQSALYGTAGVRFNFESIGVAQPRIGIGYVFPIDRGARDELQWGIVTSFVLEF